MSRLRELTRDYEVQTRGHHFIFFCKYFHGRHATVKISPLWQLNKPTKRASQESTPCENLPTQSLWKFLRTWGRESWSLLSCQTAASDMKRSEGRLFDRPLIIAGHICSATRNERRTKRWGKKGRVLSSRERGETSKIAQGCLLVGFHLPRYQKFLKYQG